MQCPGRGPITRPGTAFLGQLRSGSVNREPLGKVQVARGDRVGQRQQVELVRGGQTRQMCVRQQVAQHAGLPRAKVGEVLPIARRRTAARVPLPAVPVHVVRQEVVEGVLLDDGAVGAEEVRIVARLQMAHENMSKNCHNSLFNT